MSNKQWDMFHVYTLLEHILLNMLTLTEERFKFHAFVLTGLVYIPIPKWQQKEFLALKR